MADFYGLSSAVGNWAKQDKRENNIKLLAEWLAINPDSKKADMMEMFADNDIEFSDKTIGRYLAELGAIRTGHRWSLPTHQPAEIYTNGVVST